MIQIVTIYVIIGIFISMITAILINKSENDEITVHETFIFIFLWPSVVVGFINEYFNIED